MIQETLDHVVVQIVPELLFSAQDRARLVQRFRLLLGDEVAIEVMPLPAISRTPSGKFRYVESKVAGEYLRHLTKLDG